MGREFQEMQAYQLSTVIGAAGILYTADSWLLFGLGIVLSAVAVTLYMRLLSEVTVHFQLMQLFLANAVVVDKEGNARLLLEVLSNAGEKSEGEENAQSAGE
jgi:hypothetical protein